MTINFYQALSLLLEYPSAELIDALGELQARIAATADCEQSERAAIRAFIQHLSATPLTALQADYVKTFDFTPEHSMHLTHHLFGEDKNRGPALIDLTEMYREYGLQVASNELPDYLPLVLEFASSLDDAEARRFLADTTKVMKVIATHLEQAASPYAPLLRLLEHRGGPMKAAA